MARLLVGNVNSHGHVISSLPLVSALVDAGHSVDYLSVAHFRGPIEATGATYLPLDIDPTVVGLRVLRSARRMLRTLNDELRSRGNAYDLVLVDGIDAAIASLERDLEVPVVGLSAVVLVNDRALQLLTARGTGLPAPVRYVLGHPRLRRPVARLVTRAAFGLRVEDVTTAYGPQSSTLTLVAVAEAFQPAPGDFARTVFLTPEPRSTCDPAFPLDRLERFDGPVVYASLGTVYNRWTGFFRTVIAALPDALIVMSAGSSAQAAAIGPVPDNVLLRPYVPQTDVLARADLFITHAGMGSVSEAISAGVPTILTPRGADQYLNSARMVELGLGRLLPRRSFTRSGVRDLAAAVLADDGMRSRLAEMRAAIQSGPTLEDGVRAIELAVSARA